MTEAPILNWILYLGREVTMEVRPGFRRSGTDLKLSGRDQEYKSAFDLVRECVPHASIPFDPSSGDSLRGCSSSNAALKADFR